MPWKAVGKLIERADTGKVVGHSTSHAKAAASVRARYANTKGERDMKTEIYRRIK